MGAPSGGGVEIDVDTLRRAADLLTGAAAPLGTLAVDTARAQGDAAANAGAPDLSAALADFRTRWEAATTEAARRMGESGHLVRGSVDAHVSLDEVGPGPAPR